MPLETTLASIEPLKDSIPQLMPEGILFSFTNANAPTQLAVFLNSKNIAATSQASALLVSHTNILPMLTSLGANELALKDDIELFYLNQKVDRAQLLAKESLELNGNTLPVIPADLLQISCTAMGPKPKQLIAEINIKMPPKEVSQAPAHVVFFLDRSGSMRHEGRLEMLKPAVINTIQNLSRDTLISVYFYNDDMNFYNTDHSIHTGLETIFEAKAAELVSQEDIQRINAITAERGTNVKLAMKAMVDSMKAKGTFNDPTAYANLTVVWLTDGDDRQIKNKDTLIDYFSELGCQSMPQLIAVGMGEYKRELLNNVAEDHRFKSNLMLHISSSLQTAQLFNVVTDCIGTDRKRVILAFSANGNITFQDIGIMQADQYKKLFIELPLPASNEPVLNCRIFIDEQILQNTITLAGNYKQQNYDLLIKYFETIKDKIIIALNNNPEAAELMRLSVIHSIPPMTKHPVLRQLRHEFLISPLLKHHQERKISSITPNAYDSSFFSPASTDSSQDLEAERQKSYSASLQRGYTQAY